MKKYISIIALAIAVLLAGSTSASAQNAVSFDKFFQDSTLRLDYVFCGDAHHQAIYLERMYKTSVWAGRRNNL